MASTGRKTRAEELGLLEKKKRFLRTLPSLGDGATEKDVQNFIAATVRGQLGGLLSQTELEGLQKSASIVLRALRQRHQSSELDELEQLVRDSEQVKAKARARGVAERNRTR
jgi:hypothetical protein